MLYYSSAFIKDRGLFGDVNHGKEINSPMKVTASMCEGTRLSHMNTLINQEFSPSSEWQLLAFCRIACLWPALNCYYLSRIYP